MTIRFEKDDNPRPFFEALERLCGEDFHRCYQCGSCASSCPMLAHMDASPRKVMHLVQLGLDKQLESVGTHWVCASCLNCQVICPRNIDIPRVMEALRQVTLRQGRDYVAPSQDTVQALEGFPQIALIAAFRKYSG